MSEEMRQRFAACNAPASIQSVFANIQFDYNQARYFEEFPPAAQVIIRHTLGEEGDIDGQPWVVGDYKYLFAAVPPCVLPVSAWEHPWTRICQICDRALVQVFSGIQALEQAIRAGGYYQDAPILLTASKTAFGSFVVV